MRSTRGTEPTAYGKTVVRFARSVLSDYGRTRDEIAAAASVGAGRTSVGAMVVATPGLLTRAVELLKARSSQTTMLIEEGDLMRLLPRLRIGELDLFVGRVEPGYTAPDLETEALYNEPMSAIARPDHPPTRKAKPTWDHLYGRPKPRGLSHELRATNTTPVSAVHENGHLRKAPQGARGTRFPGCANPCRKGALRRVLQCYRAS